MLTNDRNSIEGRRAAALRALKEAELYVQSIGNEANSSARTLIERLTEEGRRMHQQSTAIILALLNDEYVPGSLFKPWASIRRIQQWRDDPRVKLDVIVRHGRICVKPSAFFKHWGALPDESKARASS